MLQPITVTPPSLFNFTKPKSTRIGTYFSIVWRERLVSSFNKEKKCFKLNKVNKIKSNYKQYKYNIEIIKNENEFKIKFWKI